MTSNKDDHNLACNNDELDPDEPHVSVYALKYIQLVVDSARAATVSIEGSDRFVAVENLLILIENLHPDEGVENQGLQLLRFILIVVEDATPGKVKNECYDQLKY